MGDALRDRCREWLNKRHMNAIMRVGNEIDDLVAFVTVERGRAADTRLEGTAPLVLYFGSEKDREEMIAAINEAKPGMAMKRMP